MCDDLRVISCRRQVCLTCTRQSVQRILFLSVESKFFWLIVAGDEERGHLKGQAKMMDQNCLLLFLLVFLWTSPKFTAAVVRSIEQQLFPTGWAWICHYTGQGYESDPAKQHLEQELFNLQWQLCTHLIECQVGGEQRAACYAVCMLWVQSMAFAGCYNHGISSVCRAAEWHAVGAGSVPQRGKGFFISQSHFLFYYKWLHLQK